MAEKSATKVESKPEDKKIDNGTSATKCDLTDSENILDNF